MVESDGQTEIMKGTITLISGDNLASHYLGGFKAPSGALRKCRYCMTTSDTMATEVLWTKCYRAIIMRNCLGRVCGIHP